MAQSDIKQVAPMGMVQEIKNLDRLRQLSLTQSGKAQALQTAARQFEAIFSQQLFQGMRQAGDVLTQDNPLSSQYTQFYQGMLDEQRVAQMADRGGLGVADLVVKQFSGQTFTHQDGRVLKLPMRTERVLKPYQPPNTVSNEIIDASKLGKELALKDNAWQRSSVSVKDAPLRARTIPAIGVAQEGGALSQGATPTRFNSPAEFVKHLMPLAKKAAQKMGLHPAVLVAQAALESSWGKRVITDPQGGMSYNLFGIKADPRWQGAKAVVSTLEYEQGVAARQKAAFRSYDSFEESFNDYVDFISQGPRYQQALAKVSEPSHYFDALQRAGYATDPHYASKLKKILQSDALSRYHDMEP